MIALECLLLFIHVVIQCSEWFSQRRIVLPVVRHFLMYLILIKTVYIELGEPKF
jgi:hypothetical protein